MEFPNRSDALVAGVCIRSIALSSGVKFGALSPKRVPVALLLTVNGLVVEPFAWLQSLWFGRTIQAGLCPDESVVIGHWRSGTTYMHQLLVVDPGAAPARNHCTIAPQAALVQSPLITLQQIYSALQISGWDRARDAIAARITKGMAYQAQPAGSSGVCYSPKAT